LNQQTPWEKAAASEGLTASERALTRLAKKAFLSLWSYSNVFTDEGRANGRGDGKELCDLLVVFGNDVLMFSDKECEYHSGTEVNVAWPRWYKRAIEKSAKQLAGAEKFARQYPQRIFLDRQCQTPLPVPLPSPEVARYFLIAVTRGAHAAARQHFGGGSSGSLMLDSSIRGRQHFDHPFQLGFPLESGRFVHVLDEMTVDILLEELDTVPDFVSYLACKEAFFSTPGVVIAAPGEEDVLARYMLTMRGEQHALPEIPDGMTSMALPEGEWREYARSPQRQAKRQADEVSYLWDSIIEHHSKFIRAGRAITLEEQPSHLIDHERIVRAMAQQNRLVRRQCGADLDYVLSREEPQGVFTRIHMTGAPPDRAFVFLAAKRQPDMTYEQYRRARMQFITTYCNAIKGDVPTLQEVIGVSAEPYSDGEASFEFLYVDHAAVPTDEQKKFWRAAADELGILRSESKVFARTGSAREFPMPFSFGSMPSTPFASRAERRRAERVMRKALKRRR
jgi:hypothetical protein